MVEQYLFSHFVNNIFVVAACTAGKSRFKIFVVQCSTTKTTNSLPHKNYQLYSMIITSAYFSIQHDAKVYQQAVFKSYIQHSLKSGFPLKDLNVVKPSITSVDFRRHGREISVTVNGNNLWFCYHIKISRYRTEVCAKDTSQHSLQFNYDAENDTRVVMDADDVKVDLSSHFSNPVKNVHVKVSRKVCCICNCHNV